jgi:hypothetical protein
MISGVEGEILKGHLDMIVLAALSEAPHMGTPSSRRSSARAGRRSICPRERSIPPSIVSSRQASSPVAGSPRTPDGGGGYMR